MSKRIALLSAVAFSALALTSTFTAPARAEEKKAAEEAAKRQQQ